MQTVAAKLADLDAVVERMVNVRETMAIVVSSVEDRAIRAEAEVAEGLETLGAQFDAIAAATAKAAFAEEGALAPVRSDVRMLQAQVAELAQAVAEVRPRTKSPPAPTRAEERELALTAKRAALARARDDTAPAAKAPRRRRAPQ